MKVALYARVSTEKQIENYSIPVQRSGFMPFANLKDGRTLLSTSMADTVEPPSSVPL